MLRPLPCGSRVPWAFGELARDLRAQARSVQVRVKISSQSFLFYFTCFLWGLESIMGGLGVSGRPWAVLRSLGAFFVLTLGLASGPWRVLGECERPARSCGMKEGPGEVLGMGKPTAWDMG